MKSTEKKSRRNFLSTVAVAATSGLAVMYNPTKAGNNSVSSRMPKPLKFTPLNPVNGADKWFKNVKGSHRIVFDGAEPNNALPIIWTWAFYLTNNQTETPDDDMTAICVFRHKGIPFALEDKLWKKYKLGEFFQITDNTTNAPALRNPYYEPTEKDFPMPGIDGIKQLQERGAMFCVCNLALSVYSGVVANKYGLDPEATRKEWVDGVLPGIQIVPSGVWALGRAQENGCQYIFAG
jgi:intracellular sulfur oxidation DsrE/DsrF family protein